MVRFIIQEPIDYYNSELHLHSNMVRFIITNKAKKTIIRNIFTFQYG